MYFFKILSSTSDKRSNLILNFSLNLWWLFRSSLEIPNISQFSFLNLGNNLLKSLVSIVHPGVSLVLSIIAFAIASKGFSVLYLFLLADLFCCAFVLTVFYSFYNKKLNEKTAYISIIIGLIGGFLLFPAPDFSKSLLVGIILPADTFPAFVSQSLLFLSFIIATFLPVIFWKIKGSKK